MLPQQSPPKQIRVRPCLDTLPSTTHRAMPGLRALYRQESRWQAWLDVEVALAKAQEELGIIPQGAAAAIAAAARLEKLDEQSHRRGPRAHGPHPRATRVGAVTGNWQSPIGRWVHWEATTQNITQTGDLLIRCARRAHLPRANSATSLAPDGKHLAERGAEMALPGRTHGQHAMPETFGYKVAVWRSMRFSPRRTAGTGRTRPVRCHARRRRRRPFASLGRQGPAVQSGIGKHLRFGTVAVPSRALGDHLAENICLLAMLAAPVTRWPRDLHST